MTLPKASVICSDRYRFAEQAISRHLKSGKNVFDIGAGAGPMKKIITNLGMNWTGFDLFPKADDILHWNLDEKCPKGNHSCDAAILLDVIEHLKNCGTALQNISSAMKKSGILILTTPNPRWSKSRLMALKTGFPACFTPQDLELNHHVFPVWPHILVKLLWDAGFSVKEYSLFEGPTSKWPSLKERKTYIFRLFANMICRLIEHNDITACSMSYGVVAEKM